MSVTNDEELEGSYHFIAKDFTTTGTHLSFKGQGYSQEGIMGKALWDPATLRGP